MTNAEYIKQHLTDLDLAHLTFPHTIPTKDKPPLFSDKMWSAWSNWAASASNNLGNMAAGHYHSEYGDYDIEENPSIWAWEEWCYPDGKWRKSGRNHIISFLVWLSKQYDPEDWRKDE